MTTDTHCPDDVIVIEAGHDDATTCPSCRVAVPLGQYCACGMRWRG